MKYPLVEIEEASSTKEKIVLVAVRMFAESGFSAVSVRDIAKQVGIKAASIYNHFDSKEAIFDSIIDMIKSVYSDFYDRVGEKIERVTSFKQALACLFEELKTVYHMFIFYGVSLIATEQFRNEKARHAFNDIFMRVGIDYSKKIFDECIEKKWVHPFDTEALATFFMNSVFAGTLMRTLRDMDFDTAYDPTSMFVALQTFMLGSVEIIG